MNGKPLALLLAGVALLVVGLVIGVSSKPASSSSSPAIAAVPEEVRPTCRGGGQPAPVWGNRICIGMSSEKVRELFGDPARVNRTTTAAGSREQWVFEKELADGSVHKSLFLYFDGNAELAAIQE